jgi:hypothetical protein
MIHWSWLLDASSCRAIVGNATFTIVLSMTISMRLRLRTPRIAQRRSWI